VVDACRRYELVLPELYCVGSGHHGGSHVLQEGEQVLRHMPREFADSAMVAMQDLETRYLWSMKSSSGGSGVVSSVFEDQQSFPASCFIPCRYQVAGLEETPGTDH
jgi:hypothetical protein